MTWLKSSLFFLSCLFLFSCSKPDKGYVIYKPVYVNHGAKSANEIYIVSSERVTPEHIENIIIVLEYYKVNYIEKQGELYLPIDIWKDKDAVMNFTKKASDPDWVKNHKG